MIQPVSAFSPRADFRGSRKTYGNSSNGLSNSGIALINAGGIALSAGGLTTAIARSYTSSWGHAGVLGVCGAFLSMFFMAPHLIEKAILNKNTTGKETGSVIKDDSPKVAEVVKEHLKPARKLVQFRQQS